MKKLVSLLLTVVMLMSLLPTVLVSAAEVTEPLDSSVWAITKKSSADGTVSAVMTNAEKYDGNGSLHVQYTAGTTGYYVLDLKSWYGTKDSKYQLTWYMKGDIDGETPDDGIQFRIIDRQSYDISAFVNNRVGTGSRGETDANGWTKYTYTATSTGESAGMFLLADCDVYVDCIQVHEVATDGTVGTTDLLGGVGSFAMTTVPEEDDEEDVTPAEPVAPEDIVTEAYDADMWEVAAKESADGTFTAQKTNEYKYAGTGSLHLDYDYGTKGYHRLNCKTLSLTSGTTYQLSWYMKGEYDGTNMANIDVRMIDGNSYTIEKYKNNQVSGGVRGETDINGWTKYTYTRAASASPTKAFFFFAACDVYIDEIKVQEVLSDGSLGADLLNGAGSFDVTLPEEEEPGDDPATETTNIPDFTGVALDSTKWTAKARGTSDTIVTTNTDVIAMTNAEYVEGNGSMHITFSQTTYPDHYLQVLPSVGVEANNKYKVTFYLKNEAEESSSSVMSFKIFGFAQYSLSAYGTASVPGSTKEDAGNGWTKYTQEMEVSTAFSPQIVANKDCDIYVDGFMLQKYDATTQTYGEDLWEDAGRFDIAITDAYKVYGAKLFEAADKTTTATEISAMSTALSGKTVTAAAYVKNYTATTPVSAQVILCLYDGYELKDVQFSDVTSVATTDGTKLVTADMTLPTFTEVGGYTIKAFVWESFDRLSPLTGALEIK